MVEKPNDLTGLCDICDNIGCFVLVQVQYQVKYQKRLKILNFSQFRVNITGINYVIAIQYS